MVREEDLEEDLEVNNRDSEYLCLHIHIYKVMDLKEDVE